MRRRHTGGLILTTAVCVLLWAGQSYAEKRILPPPSEDVQNASPLMGIDPNICAALQKQVDSVTSISGSGLTEQEKINRLTQHLAQSIASMRQSAKGEPDAAVPVQQYVTLIQALLAVVRSTPDAGNSSVPTAAAEGFQKFQALTSTYVNLVKVMCPSVALPTNVTNPDPSAGKK